MKVNAVIGVGKRVKVVILHASQIQLVEEGEGALHVNIVVCYAVHHQKADVAAERSHVADRGVVVALIIMLWCMHVTLCVDRV